MRINILYIKVSSKILEGHAHPNPAQPNQSIVSLLIIGVSMYQLYKKKKKLKIDLISTNFDTIQTFIIYVKHNHLYIYKFSIIYFFPEFNYFVQYLD